MKEYKSGEYTIQEYYKGSKVWYYQGKCHREDGPACEYSDGSKEWYIHDKLVYSDNENHLKEYSNLSESFKRTIIKYRLRR